MLRAAFNSCKALRLRGLVAMDGVTLAVLAAAVVVAGAALFVALRAARPQGNDQLAQLAGRLSQLAESHAAGQARMSEQLQAQERAIAEHLQKSGAKSAETMSQLQERLAVIDAAQKNIASLSQEVVSLQDILSNKQARGAIGQTQMEDLVRNVLPPGAFDFQVTLSNGKRADCVIRLPAPPGMIAIDSKYPHEAYVAMTKATDDRTRTLAETEFKANVLKHVRDIADKYIIAGETADQAIMFVPAESVFAEIHDRFPMVVEEGFKRRVYIVSPTTLWATLNTIRTILKDARMREQAHVIQMEIGKLMEDMVRLNDRVTKLGTHFEQAQKDVREIGTSTDKIIRRGHAIANVQLEDQSPATKRLLAEEELVLPERLQ
jgi:DNA recombination protein RmuC